MKEVQPIAKDKIVIVKQAEQEKQNKLVGRIRPIKGHTLYEVNLKNGEVNAAKCEGETLIIKDLNSQAGENHKSKKVMVNKDCVYVSALNVKNLFKKLIKAGLINA